MKRKLSFKFLFVYIAVAVSAFLIISLLGSYLVSNVLMENTSKSLYSTAQQIASSYSGSGGLDSKSVYDNLCTTAKYTQTSILVLDAQGKIYVNTDLSYADNKQESIENFDPLDLGTGYYSTGNFFGMYDDDTISVMVPITSNMRTRGYVSVHVPVSQVYAERESILSVIHTITGFIFLLTLLVYVLMHFWIYAPLKSIAKGARQLAAGDLTSTIDVRSSDELGELAETLNYMGSELSKSSEYQRKFISNVSHDFRSPLTSIKGYVEAIRDGVIPPELQGKYLDVVVSETERLNKLTKELLSLDSIDNRVRKMNYSRFNINKLIRDTVLTFEGICGQKGIKFTLLLEADPLHVFADYSKIQQVMYNLIDNAIKFSNPNSEINIETSIKKEKAYISVKDHGVGISNKDLNKIWQRFYKTDSSRGKDRTGTGLGLSIVRDIIEAHEQKITAVSTEGVGTDFTFTLDTAEYESDLQKLNSNSES